MRDFIDDFFYGMSGWTKIWMTVTIVIVIIGMLGYLLL